jgi:hypothetical protein
MCPKLISFKSTRISQEWFSGKLDGRLVVITYALAGYVFNEFGKLLIITEIFRTDEEQDFYYSNDPAYKVSPWRSTHQEWRAADIRGTIYAPDELKKIEKFLNDNFVYNKAHPIAVLHDIGLGFHIHIQVDGDGQTEIKSHIINSRGE